MFYFELTIRCELRSAEVPSKWGVSKQYLCNVWNTYIHSNYILLCGTSVCRLPNALPDASRMSANLKPQFPYKCTNLVAWSTESHEDRPQLPSRESRKLLTKWWTHLWVMWALDWTGGVAVWPGGLAGRRGPPEPPAPGASQAACNIRQPNAPPMLQESSLFSRSFWTNYSSCSLSLTSLHSSPVARTRLV